MTFPFSQLSVELALEIIQLAAQPEFKTGFRGYYTTAIALCLVAHDIRAATMPHLLRTVVLSTQGKVHSFVNSLHLQETHKATGSRLYVMYANHVSNFWSTDCWERLVDDRRDDRDIDFGMLANLVQSVNSFGLTFHSMHLLSSVLRSSMDQSCGFRWECKKLTLAGDHWRWRPITSSREGVRFLMQITHLALWIPPGDRDGEESLVPSWMKSVPLSLFGMLTHLAFPVAKKRSYSLSWDSPIKEMVVYIKPHNKPPEIFETWLFGDGSAGHDPLRHGVVVPVLDLETGGDKRWEIAYGNRLDSGVWIRAKNMLKNRNEE